MCERFCQNTAYTEQTSGIHFILYVTEENKTESYVIQYVLFITWEQINKDY
jgi:hypothetical protein